MPRLTIDQMIADLIRREGGYVNNAADKGGETNFGITVAVARKYGYTGQMYDLPQGVAEAIYRKQYFTDPGFDRVALLSSAIAEEMFDTGVNMGVSVPGPWLQRWLNAFVDGAPLVVDGAPLVVDGAIGPATINALRAFLARRGVDGETVMVKGLNCLQGARYLDLTEGRAANKAFIYGWMLNRVGV